MYTFSFEDLDTSHDQAAFEEVQDSLRVLEDYYGQISSAGGISRDQAKRLVTECGVQFGERYPENSFTEIPSATNISVAMEGMLSAGAKMLWDLIKKAGELLMKIVRWCSEFLSGQRENMKQFHRVQGNLTLIHQQNEKIRQSGVTKGQTVKPSMQSPVNEAKERVDTARERFVEGQTELWSDVATDGPAGRLLRELSVAAFGFVPKVRQKLNLFDKVLSTHGDGSESAELAQLSELRTIATKVSNEGMVRTVSHYHLPNGHLDTQGTVGDLLTSVYRAISEMNSAKPEKTADLDATIERIADPNAGFNNPFVLIPEELKRELDGMEKELHRLTSIEPSRQASDRIRNAFRDAVASVSNDIEGIRSYFAAVMLCIRAQQGLINGALAYESALFEYNRLVASNSGDVNAEKLVDEAIEAISKSRRGGL